MDARRRDGRHHADRGSALGLNTAWFSEAIATTESRLVAHTPVRVVSAVAFLALKFAAFCDRGAGDLYGSQDLEDFMAVVDGRAAIVEEVDHAAGALRGCVIAAVKNLVSRPGLADALPGYLPLSETERVASLAEKLSRIAQLE